jgi:hypothetical protein
MISDSHDQNEVHYCTKICPKGKDPNALEWYVVTFMPKTSYAMQS